MLQKSSIERTAEVFFANPTKNQYLMGISRTIGIAHTSVKKNLLRLVKLGMVEEKVDRRGGRKFPLYVAKREESVFRQQKKVYNLAAIGESGLIGHLEEKLTPKAIVLFGSYRRGEDVESSDIDLFIECEEAPVNLAQFQKKLDRRIELHFKEDFTTYAKELKNNIINGIVLSGFLEGYQ